MLCDATTCSDLLNVVSMVWLMLNVNMRQPIA